MATSNDEMDAAQVVANWLRELADRCPCGVPLEKFLGSLDVGVLAGHCEHLLDSDDVGSVAGLIDPTCRDASNSYHMFVCSKCGCELDVDCREGEPTMWDGGAPAVPRYCPNCRSRVVR